MEEGHIARIQFYLLQVINRHILGLPAFGFKIYTDSINKEISFQSEWKIMPHYIKYLQQECQDDIWSNRLYLRSYTEVY